MPDSALKLLMSLADSLQRCWRLCLDLFVVGINNYVFRVLDEPSGLLITSSRPEMAQHIHTRRPNYLSFSPGMFHCHSKY